MGIRIKTDDYGVRVWRNDKYGYTTYSISIQGKKDDGGYVNEYKQVKFRKGIELENGSEIIIHDAFPTLDTWKDKQTGEFRQKEVWIILDFSYLRKQQERPMQRERKPVSRGSLEDFDVDDHFEAVEDSIPF